MFLAIFSTFPFVLGNPLHYIRGFSAGSSYDFSEYLSFSSGYYYMVIDDVNFSGSVSKIMRFSVPPEPSPSDSPGVDDPDSRLIFSSFNVDEGDTIYPNDDVRRLSVSPVSVEMSEPNSGTNGYSYILNYHVELPSRFFYRGHQGTALSNPVVTSDLSIEFYGNGREGYVYQYSDPVVSLGSDVSHDILDSLSGTSGVMTGDVGYALMDIPVRNDISIYSYPLILDWSVYVSTFEYPAPMINSVEYMCFLDINSITFHRDSFTHVTDSTSDQILDEIHKEQVGQHQEEIDKANEASDAVTDGVTQLTGTLSSWEIFTMPVKLVTDFVTAVSSDASSGLTFPSFSMMGYEIWPAYTFDLRVIAEKFPVLYDSLHLITGILIFIAFVKVSLAEVVYFDW